MIKHEVMLFYAALASATAGIILLSVYGFSIWTSSWMNMMDLFLSMSSVVLYAAGMCTLIELLCISPLVGVFEHLDDLKRFYDDTMKTVNHIVNGFLQPW